MLDILAFGWKRVGLPKVGEAPASDDEIKMQNREHVVCREQRGCYGPTQHSRSTTPKAASIKLIHGGLGFQETRSD